MIRWLCDCEIEVCEDIEADSIVKTRKKGEVEEAEIVGYATTIEEDKKFPQLQFADGSISLGLCSEWFEEIEDDQR